MNISELLTSPVYAWVVLPVLIFFSRIVDVSLGTMRIIFLSRERRYLVPILGFFEVLIWIVVISQLVKNINHPLSYIAYAAGFATGNFVGILIERRLALGMLAVRLVSNEPVSELAQQLHNAGYGATVFHGEGATGKVHMIYTIIKRIDLPEVVRIIHSLHPKTFYSIEEVRTAREGVFPERASPFRRTIQRSRK